MHGIRAPEGLGKSTFVLREAARDALEYNERTTDTKFACFASRSYVQAEKKAAEFSEMNSASPQGAQVIKSFLWLYRDACKKCGVEPIDLNDFDEEGEQTFVSLLSETRSQQPEVFQSLLDEKAEHWSESPFDEAATIIFTSHSLLQVWESALWTRAWYHPLFDPNRAIDNNEELDDEIPDYRDLAREFRIGEGIIDDPEYNSVLHVVTAELSNYVMICQEKHKSWSRDRRSVKFKHYLSIRLKLAKLGCEAFERFDELMRINFQSLQRCKVNFDAIPYGFDNGAKGIYKNHDGDEYYLGLRENIFESNIRWTILTTEKLVSRILVESYRLLNERREDGRLRYLAEVFLEHVPGVFPVTVRCNVDPRAKKAKISDLVKELGQKGYVNIIANGAKGVGATTFQSMKGRNDMAEDDLAIIPTMLNGAHFAELNVIGVWLGIPDIITRYTEDQINQAVGRARGYRDKGAKVEIFSTHRLHKLVLFQLTGRVRLVRG
jgi:hypothetical protein